MQQLFMPLLPLLFWFLCFSTVDTNNNYKFVDSSFRSTFHSQALIIPKPEAMTSNNSTSSVSSTQPEKAPAKTTERHVEIVQAGATLASIFAKYQLSTNQLFAVLHAGNAQHVFGQIKPGQQMELVINNKYELQELVYHVSHTHIFKVTAEGNTFKTSETQLKPEKVMGYAGGTIKNSFYLAARKAGLNSKQIMELTKVFNSKVDFAKEIHPGDQFHVLYNEEFIQGKKLRNGDVVAAEFISGNKSHKIIYYTDPKGRSDYYTEEGNSTSQAFVRKPILNARVSSSFNLHRMHPVLHIAMPHYGADFAAPIGTPIKATGEGKVAFAGSQHGYGNVVIIQHNQRYSTLYAHMSHIAKNLKPGVRVKLGQTIGYVGMTGRSTGPHVHFEFRINGKRYDPMKVPLPHAESVAKIYRQDFMEKLAKYTHLLEMHKRAQTTQVE